MSSTTWMVTRWRSLDSRRPGVRSKQPEASLHERVVEVSEHDVGSAIDEGLVEHDRPDPTRVRVFEPFEQALPGAAEWWHLPGLARSGQAVDVGRFEWWLLGQREADVDDVGDGLGAEVEFALGRLQSLAEIVDVAVPLAFALEDLLVEPLTFLGMSGVEHGCGCRRRAPPRPARR